VFLRCIFSLLNFLLGVYWTPACFCILDFHHADSVSIAFHRRRGRGKTLVHVSNLIWLGEIYICYWQYSLVQSCRRRVPLLRPRQFPTRFTMFSSECEPSLLEFISVLLTIAQRPNYRIFRDSRSRFSLETLIYLPPVTPTSARLNGYSAMCIIGQFLGWNAPIRKSSLCLSVVLRSQQRGAAASLYPKNHQGILHATSTSMIWKIVIV